MPAGWLFLGLPLFIDSPVEPFVLATLFLGMVPAALLLTRYSTDATIGGLLRDSVRLPRPLALLLPALLMIPAATWVVAAGLGVQTELSNGFLTGLAVNVFSSVLIINLWEEMVWAGFVQRQALRRWGFIRSAILTAMLFTGIHMPLVFYGADGTADVLYNVGVMLVSGLGMRLLIGAFDQWGRGSILALALLHASFNVSSELVDSDHDWVRYAVTLGLGLTVLLFPRIRRARAAGTDR
ncbi:hypothetical protein GCM10009843_02840 [Nocardioides bigeumensis]|uniref:CAAX prenyl protease 2/Lysostaphin resistance protein A-like domain-containing protein n=1 Tax=Nocardioides bigeumensis TaxID=433657 RepID=A0ABN2XNK0_9ACTN